ncbi:MAG: GDP-mannose 4,6-dehydratase [Acidobacteria bacterium]|nr:GDP-mannose 4,6-dehydratase [Acidobacteriota bacterium]
MKSALITGITGQDGSYLTRLLLGKGYVVHGIIRRSSSFNTGRLDDVYQDPHESSVRLKLHYGDMADGASLRKILREAQPDEIYNLAAQSHVMVSFQQPEYTADITSTGVLRLLEAVRDYAESTGKKPRMYQAGSSEMFGATPPMQHEGSMFRPQSPYAVSKVAAHWHCVNYRDAHGLFVSNGILFNHESPARGETFVTRKITRSLTRIKAGIQDKLYMGNLDALRDWGYAGDYVEAMWLMLQQDEPGDFVVATGRQYSVEDFLGIAGEYLGLDWKKVVEIDPRYLRPNEVVSLCGDPSLAKKTLGWEPKVDLPGLVRMMCDHDLRLAEEEARAVASRIRTGVQRV